MLAYVLFALLPIFTLASLVNTYGVDPALLPRYVPTKGHSWTCLDGSKQIPWSAVNDDYCDCPDSSDEPGTSACPNSTFYCRNEGYFGASIPSSRVNDGLCEPNCCDGSDEYPGVCKNVCSEIGEVYRRKRDAARKIQKTGAKIRSTYISFAQKEKRRFEDLISSTSREISVRVKEVARLKDIADRTETMSKAALEHKQESPLYKSLIKHSNALKSLQKDYKKHLEREKALGDILNTLRSGYNPNYQDMAVLEAVRGWEFLAGLPHIGEEVNEEGSDEGSDEEPKTTESAVELEEGMWTTEQLENDLEGLLKSDYVSLLLAHEEHIASPVSGSILFDLASYMPDSLAPQYNELKNTIVSWLQTLGIAPGSPNGSADASRARQAFTDAEHSLKIARDEKKHAEESLHDLFDVEGFGIEGEWKKLDGTCLEKDTGDYIYELCMFDEARQRPKHGGSTFSLGKFKSWNPSSDVQPGDPEYYSQQIYNGGAKCWNGPERSVIFVMTCGTENEIHSVVELEKCEYQFTGTSPVLCLPLQDKEREEL